MASTRQEAILDIARLDGEVHVDALVRRFDVTPQTIRKDLNALCHDRWLERTHGGARLATSIENMSYAARRVLAARQKHAIGQAVASLIPEDASLFINIGTTNEAVARALVRHRRLMVLTNDINVAAILRESAVGEVIISGGTLRAADGGIVGEHAVEFVGRFRPDFAVIGVSAIEHDGSLLDYDPREVQVARAIVASARHVIVAADSSKFERSASVRIAHLGDVHSLVTDRCPDAEIRRLARRCGVRLVETASSPSRRSSPRMVFD